MRNVFLHARFTMAQSRQMARAREAPSLPPHGAQGTSDPRQVCECCQAVGCPRQTEAAEMPAVHRQRACGCSIASRASVPPRLFFANQRHR